ncbi:MAG: TOBE domain-containing protein [Campylobacterota bacterium]|nr:TOBE domain-containing protein [Campylobacterota bacterium]
MNQIDAVVTGIEYSDAITIVSFEAANQALSMVALELDERLAIGSSVTLGVKATNISIATEPIGLLSISNQLNVTIDDIKSGELLSSIKFTFAGSLIESIVSRSSADRMDLGADREIIALIKASELSILEINL